jgi:HK97 family phage portal protein
LVNVVIDDSETGIKGYLYNNQYAYQKDQIIHFKNPNLTNPFYGVSAIKPLTDTLLLDGASLDELKTFYEGSSLISGLIKSELPLTPEQIQAMREQFRELYGKQGKYKRGTAVLPSKADYIPIQANPKDSMLLDSLKVSEQRILRAFKLHPIVLGGEVATSTAPQELMRMVFNTAVRPYIYKLQDTINLKIRELYKGVNFEFDLGRVVELETPLDVKATASRQLMITGITSLNESREIVGLEPIELEQADYHMMSVAIMGENPMYVETYTGKGDNTNNAQTSTVAVSDPLGGANDNPLDVDSTSNNSEV